MADSTGKGSNSLLTKKSLALSLSAPRVPPHGTAHRALLMGSDHTSLPWTRHHHPDSSGSEQLRRRLLAYLESAQQSTKAHPHLPTGPELVEYTTRFLGVWLPLSLQHWIRDSGNLRVILDALLTYTAPAYLLACPDALVEFSQLSQQCQCLRYGDHPSQVVDLFFPPGTPRGMVFFVHGGGWGCGFPSAYRLIASPFLNQGMAVAIVGYRTYPCGDVEAQIQDLELAATALAQHYPAICVEESELGVCLMGHSSGAHICFLYMTEWTRKRMQKLEQDMQKHLQQQQQPSPTALDQNATTTNNQGMRLDSFVGVSGVYNISHHFDYEASRGMEEISPMKAAMGFSRKNFAKHSPALKMVEYLSSEWSTEWALGTVLPRIALMHGIEDDVVPFMSTAEAAHLLRSCGVTRLDEMYFAKTGHNECALQIMMGGNVRDAVVDWIEKTSSKKQKEKATKSFVVTSKL
ncbi:Carboxylesterase [Seminavis robusta]|uniref:Carboxylesterase n=1 Tax=Seminavis robusta TaxID=568900 RepID=A0A9N8EFP1_9STRA|nr:Carboxylesterase [Seminavis robusta]|eukprot:Sro1010_g230910.1 Carboxylesterase (463) ;mRNA; r:28255-29838